VRIISGTHRGRKLRPPANLILRPTTDQAKESLFNILVNTFDFQGVSVLDLFAGTGGVSYEFASRGCEDITLVEQNNRCIRFINDTIQDLKLEGVKVVRSDVFKFIEKCRETFDIVFADPPYDSEGVGEIPQAVIDKGMITQGGWLILEHKSGLDFSANAHFQQKRSYGDVNFSIFKV